MTGTVQCGAVAELPVRWYPSTDGRRDGGSGLGSGARAKQSPFAMAASSTDAVQELKNALKDKQYFCENGSWSFMLG